MRLFFVIRLFRVAVNIARLQESARKIPDSGESVALLAASALSVCVDLVQVLNLLQSQPECVSEGLGGPAHSLAYAFWSCTLKSIPGGIKAISRWFERSEHHRITSKMQSDPERIAARTAVIPTGMSVYRMIVSPGIASLDPGLMA